MIQTSGNYVEKGLDCLTEMEKRVEKGQRLLVSFSPTSLPLPDGLGPLPRVDLPNVLRVATAYRIWCQVWCPQPFRVNLVYQLSGLFDQSTS